MRIGIDASRANHAQKTGVEWYAYFLIQQFKATSSQFRDKKIEFILYTDKPLEGQLAQLPDNWTQKVLRWPPGRLWTQIRLSWEMLVNSPDVLFIPAHVVPFIHPKKTVMTIHDIAARTFPETYNWFERWYSIWSSHSALKKLWRVVVPSEFTKSELENMEYRMLNMEKVFVTHLGYDDTKYKKIDNASEIDRVLKKYSITKPFLLTIGRLEEKKNSIRIINAFEQVRNNKSLILDFVLVGKPGYGYKKIRETIENSPYKNSIITPGWVDEEDVPILMNAAKIFLFPSLYEGFGIPVLEAMACGTPVLASKGNSLQEVGGDACIYVDPLNTNEISIQIQYLLTDETLRQENIKKGFERIKQFSWEKCARETLNILIKF